jgi:hypothetical protein
VRQLVATLGRRGCGDRCGGAARGASRAALGGQARVE